VQEERSRGEHNLTNISKTQERVQAEKGGKKVYHVHVAYMKLYIG